MTDRWLTSTDVAERLGISEISVGRWRREGRLPEGRLRPGIKIGRKWTEAEIDAWMRDTEIVRSAVTSLVGLRKRALDNDLAALVGYCFAMMADDRINLPYKVKIVQMCFYVLHHNGRRLTLQPELRRVFEKVMNALTSLGDRLDTMMDLGDALDGIDLKYEGVELWDA